MPDPETTTTPPAAPETPPAPPTTPPASSTTTPPPASTPPAGTTGDAGNQPPVGDPPPPPQEPDGPPERYALDRPEGMTDSEAEEFEAVARAMQLNNTQANAVLGILPEIYDAQGKRFETRLRAMPEFQGEQLSVARTNITRVLDRFAPGSEALGAELRRGLTTSGYGNWPPLVALMARIGAAMSDDRPAGGPSPSGGREKTFEEVMYPNQSGQPS